MSKALIIGEPTGDVIHQAVSAATQHFQSVIEELYQLAYVPGVWHCRECGYVVSKNILSPSGRGADTREDVEGCPNDGTQLFPRSWKDHYIGLEHAAFSQIDRAMLAEGRVAELETLIRDSLTMKGVKFAAEKFKEKDAEIARLKAELAEAQEAAQIVASQSDELLDALMEANERLAIQVGPALFEFTSFEDWSRNASHRFRSLKMPSFKTICLDTAGRVCGSGEEMMRAAREQTFPVIVYHITPEAGANAAQKA